MYLGDTHTGSRTDVEFLMREFGDELDRIVQLHRYVIRSAMRDFSHVYDRLLSEHNPETYDGGDAIWDAEQELGVNPWEVEEHFGLLSLARAVSLAEIVLARLAAACWEKPELTVFPNGRTWTRQWESEFYGTCLKVRFDTQGKGFGMLRALRDLYMHGYGVPVNEAQLHQLAAQVHQQFSMSAATPDEAELGYEGVASFFGPYATYDSHNGLRNELGLGLPKANLTPLATYRAMSRVREHIIEATQAVLSGPRDDIATSKFIQTVETWWTRRGGLPQDT